MCPIPGYFDNPASKDYVGGFAVDLIIKDLNIALECGDEIGFDWDVLRKCRDLYQIASDNGDGNKDFAIVYQYMRKM